MHDKLRHIFVRDARGQNGRERRSNDNDPKKHTRDGRNKNICGLASLSSFYIFFFNNQKSKNTSIFSLP